MGKVTLTIEVDLAGRQRLQAAGERIAVVCVMTGDPVDVVVAAVFDPLGSSTTVAFDAVWQLYVMQGPVQPLKAVNMQVCQATDAGEVYTFDGVGFSREQRAYDPTVFGLTNAAGDVELCAGLAQQLTVANADVSAAVHIAGFPSNTTCYYQPTDDILVFVVNGVVTGEVLPAAILQPEGGGEPPRPVAGFPTLVGQYLRVTMDGDVTIHYDDRANCFGPGSLSV